MDSSAFCIAFRVFKRVSLEENILGYFAFYILELSASLIMQITAVAVVGEVILIPTDDLSQKGA